MSRLKRSKAPYSLAHRPNTPIPHGTLGGYTNHGCRCDDCRRANRENQRTYRDAHPERERSSGRLR